MSFENQSYAIVVKEEFLQVMGMSAPIWNEQGKVAACLSMWTSDGREHTRRIARKSQLAETNRRRDLRPGSEVRPRKTSA